MIYRENMTLESSCNEGCGCISSQFNPICGIDGVTYFSPCYAGCNREIQLNDVKVIFIINENYKNFKIDKIEKKIYLGDSLKKLFCKTSRLSK